MRMDAWLRWDRLDPGTGWDGVIGKEGAMSVHPAAGATRPVTTATFRALKAARQRIVVITAYDAPSARLVDAAGVDAILVGDSMGMTVLGHTSTLPVTMDDILRATAAVVRGTTHALVIADMPFMSFQVSAEDALRNAGRLLAEGGAGAVKLEGGEAIAPTVARMTAAGIAVMGHVGLTPQSVGQLGGYRVQGKDVDAADGLVRDCLALQEAGAFAIVLECIPAELAELVSAQLAIPTIGIGAGSGCDGEVQVFHDLLGISDFTPRHAKRYAEIGAAIESAVSAYAADVRSGAFPGEEQCVRMDPQQLAELRTRYPSPADGEQSR
jgi:3-methyl-2-oxobutanoate hydroxymethyltransferase